MALRKLEKPEWQRFADTVTKILVGKRAEIEVASLDLGDQIEAEWLPVLGVAYDPKDDVFEIALENVNENVDHLIRGPREVFAEIGPPGLAALEVVDSDGRRQIVHFREPLMLPPPQGAASGGPPSGGTQGRQ